MKIEKRHLLNYSILIPYLILSIIGLDCRLFDNKCLGNSKWSEFDSDGPDTGALFHPKSPNHRFDL